MAWIDQFEFIIISVAPRELVSYKTLIRPFDTTTWSFLAGSISSAILLLIVINSVTEGKNYLQKGKLGYFHSNNNCEAKLK